MYLIPAYFLFHLVPPSPCSHCASTYTSFPLCLDCSPCILGQRVPNHHPLSEAIIPPEEALTAILAIPGNSQHITLLRFLTSIG